MSPLHASAGRIVCLGIALSFAAGWGCGDESVAPVSPTPVSLTTKQVKVVVDLDPFVFHIQDADGHEVLTSLSGPPGDASDVGTWSSRFMMPAPSRRS